MGLHTYCLSPQAYCLNAFTRLNLNLDLLPVIGFQNDLALGKAYNKKKAYVTRPCHVCLHPYSVLPRSSIQPLEEWDGEVFWNLLIKTSFVYSVYYI